MAKKIAIKIDVDTKRGYDEGVPRMLDVFKQEDIKATFFFSMGTDNSGKAIRRIFVLSKKITNVAFIVGIMFIGKINCLS